MLSPKKTYIIGVSGGPDSMALLHMCHALGLHLVVAHMNYQKRKTALRDEQIVLRYCEENGIPCKVYRQNKECKGNFQAFAREERYAMYRELLENYHGEAVVLAHHLDDHLETYLMQKERGSVGVVYGIQEEAYVLGCRVLRPLLDQTKEDLLTYCKTQGIMFGIDESNLTQDYTRNRIRHTIIDPMTRLEKEILVKEIETANATLRRQRDEVAEFLDTWKGDIASLHKVDTLLQGRILRHWIANTIGVHVSEKEIHQLQELLKKANNWTREINHAYGIDNQYGYLSIFAIQSTSYAYRMEELHDLDTPYFHLSKTGKGVEALTLYPEDFPITIRNVQDGDAIQLRIGKKRIHRWFIDRKIPQQERKSWPVVVNAAGNVIMVPGIGCDIAHFSNNPSVFVVK